MDKIYQLLQPDMFTSELLGRVYHEYQRAYDRNYELNLSLIEQKLRSDNFPSSMIVDEIRECIRNTETSANVVAHAMVVESDYKAHKANEIISMRKFTPSKLKAEIGAVIEALEALVVNRRSKSKTLAEIARENKSKYFKEKKKEDRILIGFDKLDNLLGGLTRGDMIVLAARPSVGKSALSTQIARNLSKQGLRIGIYNLEMNDDQIYERFLVNESALSLNRVRNANYFLGDEEERFNNANEEIEKLENIIVTSDGCKKVSEIIHESKNMDFDVIIIDYLQLLEPEGTYKGNRTSEVGEISRKLKQLAKTLNIPVIALSQLNRASEGRENKEPTMSELREAGNIEQDASVIILMWNLDENDRSRKGCKIEKNRQGECGKIVMKFNGDTMRFEETSEDVKESSEWKSIDNPFG